MVAKAILYTVNGCEFLKLEGHRKGHVYSLKFLENLCYKDTRNPMHIEMCEDETEPRVNCSCDNCFHGRDVLAVFALELWLQLKNN